MTLLRLSRGALRCLESLAKPRCVHSAPVLSSIPSQRLAFARRATVSPPKPFLIPGRRHNSTLTSGGDARSPQDAKDSEDRWANTPAYEMTFTCKQCNTRSTHKMSKQGYHHGTVVITCPGCKNRHLISDHLKIFSDKRVTLEDIMKQKGQLIKRGTLSAEGDVEFWEDGTEVKRDPQS
ncbi:uncharacterized protein PV09_05741 [Verruconis gallopava]|uniref:DNL-type domain-containing protein n=1 Tax=Verruconis gallopava TaxID=253628 RepID=A0A0D1XL51_9PEZI|nr:uncharacterized protein PV09_05741 [Verruconis gallopava]KIW03096.1 hypothetical protein PV09_05741 [Verruconis gallopava]